MQKYKLVNEKTGEEIVVNATISRKILPGESNSESNTFTTRIIEICPPGGFIYSYLDKDRESRRPLTGESAEKGLVITGSVEEAEQMKTKKGGGAFHSWNQYYPEVFGLKFIKREG